MDTLDLRELLRTATPRMVGALVTGSRGERPALEAWPPFLGLSDDAKLIVEQVWDGTREESLIVHAEELHRLRHKPGGVPDPNGKRYGFIVRTVPLPSPAVPPRSGPGSRTVVVFVVLIMLAGAFAGGWFAPGFIQQETTKPSTPSVRHIDSPPSEPALRTNPPPDLGASDLDRRDRAVAEFRKQTAELEETNRRSSELLRGWKAALTALSNPEKP